MRSGNRMCLWGLLAVGCAPGPHPRQADTATPATTDAEAPAGPDSSAPDTAEDSFESGDPIDTASPPDSGVEPAPVAILQAAWAAQLKDFSNPTAGATCIDGGWNSDHAENTRQALLDGGLDTWVANLGTGSETDCWWLNFERVLAAIEPEDGIQVAGGVDPGLDFEELSAVVVQLRLLADREPELRALVLDDFMASVKRWDQPWLEFGPDEFAALAALAQDTECEDTYCSAPPLELWPYTTAKEVAYTAVPGIELGLQRCTGSCATPVDRQLFGADADHTADAMGFSLSFLPTVPTADASLRFLFNDRFQGRGAPVAELVVRQDGVELGRFALNDDQAPGTAGQSAGIRSVSLPVVLDSTLSTELEWVVEARSETVAADEDRLVRVWGVELWTDNETPLDLLSTTTPTPVARRDSTRDDLTLAAADALRLEETAPGLIAPLAPAVLVHDLEPSAFWFDLEVHRHLMDAVCRSVRTQGAACYATQWGNDQWRVDLDAAIQAERVRVARETADGVVIYRHPLDLVGGARDADGSFVPPDHGIYREVSPANPTDFDVGATWPGYTRGVPGFRRRFEQVVSCAGEWTLQWAKSGSAGRFDLHVARRTPAGEESLHRSDLAEIPLADSTSLTLAAGDVAVVEMVGTASIGNATYGFDARLVAPPECGGAAATAWTSTSHVDPDLADQFECVHAALVEQDVPGCTVE
jgi:hypothetical protein